MRRYKYTIALVNGTNILCDDFSVVNNCTVVVKDEYNYVIPEHAILYLMEDSSL